MTVDDKTTKAIYSLATKAAEQYIRSGLSLHHPTPTVVGLRVITTIEWVVSFVALMRLGYTVFILSPEISSEKIIKLMEKVDCSIVVDGTFMADEAAAGELRSTLRANGKTVIDLLSLASLAHEPSEKYGPNEQDFTQCWPGIQETHPAVILHSSGTTGLPKLVYKPHYAVLNRLRTLPGVLHGTSLIGSWHYNSVGFHSMLFSLSRGNGPAIWSNELIPLEGKEYGEILTKLQPVTAWFNPANLYASVSTSEGLNALKQADLVVTTGGVFPQQLGRELVGQGVRLVNIYGMSELSAGVRLIPASRTRGDADWEYVQAHPDTAPHIWFRPLDDLAGEGSPGTTPLYELVVLPSHPTQDKQFANRPDGSFHTGDLFVEHPSRPGCYKCLGRLSDEVRIAPDGHDHVGLNAITYEHLAMAGNGDVLQEAVLFGRESPDAGLLLFTRPGGAVAAEVIVQKVWDALDQAFRKGDLPLAIKKKMMVVIRDAKVPRTSKGNIIRPEIYQRWEEDIVASYVRR
ncbi:hypothetical protein M406DRAFT_352154 [Cryphonectria parasitica EP155]|uniref:AMP-dependent synthetase/ligase domain-containing protein n=1 Tax=Cryphonectria parasitica (strain ATCC 38755 / EP155) TaxID=660469 RepID=A0A9P4XX73_CRYP1|nr:uncharacterized protein M406DRAFT_352154 [Cryphonectria parasitica EP155]KAF3762997.1 hypothetical protein M406DRAFT_352154 [Cryphonectria parasitica EP155]